MLAYQIKHTPGSYSLEQTELKRRDPGPGEVLLRMKAVSLNYRDLIEARGSDSATSGLFGIIPTSDGAGEVIQVGKDVGALQNRRSCRGGVHAWLARWRLDQAKTSVSPRRRSSQWDACRGSCPSVFGTPTYPGPSYPRGSCDFTVRRGHSLVRTLRRCPCHSWHKSASTRNRRSIYLRASIRQTGGKKSDHNFFLRREVKAGT